jgi:hypothetical protein
MRRANLFAYFLVLGLAACGGGGGGGGSTGGSAPAGSSGGGTAGGGGGGDGTAAAGAGGTTSTRNPIPEQVALSFTATPTPATVSATTAARLMSDTVTGTRLAQAIQSEQLALIGINNVLTGTTTIQPIACDSGSITISRTAVASNGTGTLSIDYVDCRKGTDTLNGPATMTITTYDSASKIITNARLDFTRVRFTGPGLDADISGSQQTQVNSTRASWCSPGSAACGTEIMTQNMTILTRAANNTTRMMRSGLTVTNEYESLTAPTFFTQRLAGTVDDDQLGSVNVTSATAPFTGPWGDLYYSTRFQPFPDWGIVRISGATGMAQASSMAISLAKIEVNADGDAIFENNARLRWIDLATDRGANLNDSDGDRMHDSWEAAMGLDRTRDDANVDSDGDGYSNYTEYLVGADASTPGSIPAGVQHLWITNLSGIAYDDITDPAHPAINAFVGGGGDGVPLDPVTRELGTPFTGRAVPAAGGLTVTDTQGRTFTLAPTASPSVWTLSSSTGTTITIENVGGTNPTSLIRYGDRGIAFRTQGSAPSTSNAGGGYIYLIESRALIP